MKSKLKLTHPIETKSKFGYPNKTSPNAQQPHCLNQGYQSSQLLANSLN